MWRGLLLALLVAGCAQLPPTPEEIHAKKFETVPDKAVIYIVRAAMDSNEAGSVTLDDDPMTTFAGTFYRWEVAPGLHEIAGFAGETGLVKIDTQAGHLYFVKHTVYGTPRSGWQWSFLERIGEKEGRSLVTESTML